jgi:hypothetical protein
MMWLTCLTECLLASQHFQPRDFTLAAIRFFNSAIKSNLRRSPDVWASAITLNKGNNGVIRHLGATVRAHENQACILEGLNTCPTVALQGGLH